MIKNIEKNIRHLSRPESPRWHIMVNAKGQPLQFTNGDQMWTPIDWFRASLFHEHEAPGVSKAASEMTGELVKAVVLVELLDEMRDHLVRAERREAREAIHGV
ncbi:MAG: hypothetical protein ACRCUF_20725 [Aeromonas sobria]